MVRSQGSIAELLIISLAISVSITSLVAFDPLLNLYSFPYQESPLPYYLNYTSKTYNETMGFLITYLCKDPFFVDNIFEESVNVMHALNGNKSFILYIVIEDSSWRIYDKQPEVCLEEIDISRYDFNASCGQGYVLYGSWKGEAPQC